MEEQLEQVPIEEKAPAAEAPAVGASAISPIDQANALILKFEERAAVKDEDDEPEIGRRRFKNYDEYVKFERSVGDGAWRELPMAEGAEILVCSFGEVMIHEPRIVSQYRTDNGLKRDEEIPDDILLVLQAQARFRRMVRDWRGEFFGGHPFTWANFVELWRVAPAFRQFANAEAILLRDRLLREAEDLGKGSSHA